MVKLREINESVLEDSKGSFLRIKVHMPDGLRFRLLTSKYKMKRWLMFGMMLDFFEKYYDVLETKYFKMQTFLDEKKQLEAENKNMGEELISLKKRIAELNKDSV
jgi:hypothetical protein